MIIRKSQAEIEGMARAGELVRETLQLVADHLEPGVSMLELDRIADEHIAERGGYPTSKGYKGFPNALCISPNSMVVHGIPNGYRAQEGDVISVDLGVTLLELGRCGEAMQYLEVSRSLEPQRHEVHDALKDARHCSD